MSTLYVPKENFSRRSSVTSSLGSDKVVDEVELEALIRHEDPQDTDILDEDELSINLEEGFGDPAMSGSMAILPGSMSHGQQKTLHHAAFCGDLDALTHLYKDGADINTKDNYGQTPLHCAILGKQLDAARFLLNHKAKLHVVDDKQDAPIHVAVRTGDLDMLKELLVDPRADVNFKGKECVCALHVAVQMEHSTVKEICQMLLLAGADLTAKDINNRTPLCLAVMKGAHDVVDCLFRHARCDKKCKIEYFLYDADHNGSTLLHLAVDAGQPKIVELCLQYGARVDLIKESDGTTPVHMACTYGSFDTLKLLLQSVSFIYSYSLPDKQGLTCLHRAAMYDHTNIVKFLLSQGIEMNDLDNDQRTPLLLAASRGCTCTVEVLIDNGADYRMKDSKNRTLLHSVVGHSDTLVALLKHVSIRQMLTAVDQHGATALHYAAQGGFLKNVSLLLRRWTRQSTDIFVATRIRNHKGELPLHLAASHGWLDVVLKLLEVRDFRQLDAVDDFERTPLHRTAEEGHSNVVSVLLENGANITKDTDGRTALHVAASKGSLKCVAHLIRNKPHSINDQDKEQNTALHLAAQGGHAHIVRYLLSISNQKVTLNAYNQNVLDVAVGMEQAEVTMALAEHKRWHEVLRRAARASHAQIELMVKTLPHVAERFLDKCVTTHGTPDSPDYKITYDFRLLQGMPEESDSPHGSLDALETMVKHKRLGCLTHPLCQAFLNIKWRKVGLNEIIPQSVLFFTYIISLGCFILYQPCAISERRPKQTNYTCIEGNILLYGTWPFELRNDKLTRLRVMYWICVVICCLRVPKEISVMRQGLLRYLYDVENVFNFIVMICTFVFFLYVIPYGRPTSSGESTGYVITVLTVIFSGIIYIKHLRSYKVFGLYITMVLTIIKTFFRVICLLIMFIVAFAFSFYMINVDKNQLAFRSLLQSTFTSFVWMLGEFDYKDTFVDNPPTYLPGLYYFFFIMYGVCVPIIFLNLLIGLAVGDIGRIQASAELEVHARQVERLIQIERGFPKLLLNRTKVIEYVEYPNVKRSFGEKVVNLLVSLVTQTREDDKKEDSLKQRLDDQEERINGINAVLRKQKQQFVQVLQSMRHIEEFLSSPPSFSLETTSMTSLG